VLAMVLLGGGVVEAACSAPLDLIAGALSPWNEAQRLLHGLVDFARTASLPVLVGVTAAKIAVFNLLPLPMLNGGAAIAAIGQGLRLERFWPAFATTILLFVYLGVLLSWASAILLYIFSP
jgi:Zn-dependent protease